MHDPRIGRFFAVDPLAGKYPWNSPYAFATNNPVRLVDVDGLGVRPPDEWIVSTTGETVRVGDKGGDETDYVHFVNNGQITTKQFQVKKSYVSITGTEIPRLYSKSPGSRIYDATSPAIKQVCAFDVLLDQAVKLTSEKTGINENLLSVAVVIGNPKKAFSTGLKLLKEGSKGFNLAEKLLKKKHGGILEKELLPVPSTKKMIKKYFKKDRGDVYVHRKTSAIYKKSKTSHGNYMNQGEQWKIYPKGTKNFKKSTSRVTINGKGQIIGH